MKYKKNDYELVSMVKEYDDYSYYSLYYKYSPIIIKIANDFYSTYDGYGYEYEDFVQEANIGFQKAIKYFDEDKNCLFYSFASLCIKRKLISFCKRISSSKKNINNRYFTPLDGWDFEAFEESADEIMGYQELCSIVTDTIYSLNIEDASVLELKINNFTIKEISSLLDICYKCVNNRLSKGRKILKEKIESYGN